jgi:hypothetical protein
MDTNEVRAKKIFKKTFQMSMDKKDIDCQIKRRNPIIIQLMLSIRS